MRPVAFLSLLVAVAPAAAGNDRDKGFLGKINEQFKRIVLDAKPSVACVLVSRSDDYHKAPLWGVPADPDAPWRLGRFDADAARKKVPDDARQRARILRTIAQHDLSDPDAVPESYGSGLVVDRSGLVLTNAHVIKNATKIYVRLPGKRGSWADVQASDPRSDMAVLKLTDPPPGLKAVELGQGENVRTGHFVVSITNSYAPGFKGNDEPTTGWGTVSNLRQKIPGSFNELELHKLSLHHYGTLIQTNASASAGCSGGALLDLDSGKAVGLVSAIAAVRGDQQGSFAIPFDANIRRIVEVLKRGEEVEYGFLGVEIGDNNGRGLRIMNVSHGSPAARAGLISQDVLVAVNGNPINNSADLFLYVGIALAGTPSRIEYLRGGTRYTAKATLAKFYVSGNVVASKRPPARFGLRVDYASILTQRNPFRGWGRVLPTDGVLVREILPNSAADKALLDTNKLITQVNGVTVLTPAEYYREIAKVGKRVELTYLNSEGRPARLALEEP